jgi:hypothetical protein
MLFAAELVNVETRDHSTGPAQASVHVQRPVLLREDSAITSARGVGETDLTHCWFEPN